MAPATRSGIAAPPVSMPWWRIDDARPRPTGNSVDELNWYHSITLPGGLVTRGLHTMENALDGLPLPAVLDGQRCLDIGTYDGFWASEMSAVRLRGSGHPTSPGATRPSGLGGTSRLSCRTEGCAAPGVHTGRSVLGLNVQSEARSVYDLDPSCHGMFDVVFVGQRPAPSA